MTHIDKDPLEGGFNTNFFQTDIKGNLVLSRVPKPNRDLFENILYEFRAIGFTADGGRVQRRSIEEQVHFANSAASKGLPVLPFFKSGEQWSMPYLENIVPIDEYLRSADVADQEKNMAVFDLLTGLERAHRQNIIYGDRWSGNMIVDNGKVMHIDFDLELSGDYAREADLAQTLYHLIWADASRATLPLIIGVVSKLGNYDIHKTLHYLEGFSQFFTDTPVGGVGETVTQVVDAITIQKQSRSKGAIIIGNGTHL